MSEARTSECRTVGTKRIELDRTEIFTALRLRPVNRVRAGGEDRKAVQARTDRAVAAAKKHSLVANSIQPDVVVEPTIEVVLGVPPMLTIEVLGSGCTNCRNVEQVARSAISSLGVEACIEKTTDFREIMKDLILATPGLVINDEVVCAGRVPSEAEVATWLANAAAGA